ncbi:VOC family protein [Flaviaesturariibacter amylovorans]|uniref:VOC family protein n=1 Tax=Flaviaesturariibacter amylovorans TaxID=1084520 RepID=A0ABP8G8S3_9BACT
MPTALTAYLAFNGNCREVMTHYQQCLGGDLAIRAIEGSPIEAHCPPHMKHQVLHSELRTGGLLLMASDLTPGAYTQGNNFGVMIHCSSEAECRDYYAKLSAGATIHDPLGPKFWGAFMGTFTDRYGVRWMTAYDPNTGKENP